MMPTRELGRVAELPQVRLGAAAGPETDTSSAMLSLNIAADAVRASTAAQSQAFTAH